jgi:hypothetical protein|tara:strand:- start:489 stop:737 length:249 start_codon:yes stop_codon:yes gene_type:complete
MDPSQIPNDILRVLQSPELPMAKKMMAFNMLMPNLPADPKHTQAYNDNLEVGNTIKRLVDEGKISINGLDKDFKLNIITNSQ